MVTMLNVEMISTPSVGIQRDIGLSLDDYLYSSSPPRFSIASLMAGQYTPAQFFENLSQFHGDQMETRDSRETTRVTELPKITLTDYTLPQVVQSPAVPNRNGAIQAKSPKSHKRVLFADDCGKQLVHVRTFSVFQPEPSPKSGLIHESRLTRGTTVYGSLFDICPSLKECLPRLSVVHDLPAYQADFDQPAFNYAAFAEKLERNSLGLEHANLIDGNSRVVTLTGKILVKNLGFEKVVIVRCTCNNWQSHVDFEAKYVKSFVPALYDTFVFSADLLKLNQLCQLNREAEEADKSELLVAPPEYPERLEFAVCYRCSKEREFWDNNSGANYSFFLQHT